MRGRFSLSLRGRWRNAHKPRRSWSVKFGCGAGLLVALLVSDSHRGPEPTWSPPVPGAIYSTGFKAPREIRLPDGSLAILNANSELHSRFTPRERLLELTRGEALFAVSHDRYRPFYVTAMGTVVRAVGTRFSMRLQDNQHVEVMVEEGRVEVSEKPERKEGEPAMAMPPAAVLSAGDIGMSSMTENASIKEFSVTPGHATDIQRRLSWTHGQLTFNGQTVDAAVNEINRYGKVRFEIEDSSITRVRIGGSIRLDKPDDFVKQLWLVYRIRGVEVGRDADGVRVIRLRGVRKSRH